VFRVSVQSPLTLSQRPTFLQNQIGVGLKTGNPGLLVFRLLQCTDRPSLVPGDHF
jgi:hypothetical protein